MKMYWEIDYKPSEKVELRNRLKTLLADFIQPHEHVSEAQLLGARILGVIRKLQVDTPMDKEYWESYFELCEIWMNVLTELEYIAMDFGFVTDAQDAYIEYSIDTTAQVFDFSERDLGDYSGLA